MAALAAVLDDVVKNTHGRLVVIARVVRLLE